MSIRISKIVTGGQTGADRAALDVAMELDIPHTGKVPRGRRAEDGRIPDRYTGLEELHSARYGDRTRSNVCESDATLIVTFGEPTGGTALTEKIANRHGRPCLVLDMERISSDAAAARCREFLEEKRPAALNVAGPRASGEPRIYEAVRGLLTRVLEV